MTNLSPNQIQASTRSFYATKDLSGKSFDHVVSSLDGEASWSNLVSGSRSPPELLVVAQSHLTSHLLHFRNDTTQVYINLGVNNLLFGSGC